jgi:hypothetical protein
MPLGAASDPTTTPEELEAREAAGERRSAEIDDEHRANKALREARRRHALLFRRWQAGEHVDGLPD